MTRHRNNDGRFISGESGGRPKTKSFRATQKTSEELKRVASAKGMSLADLIEEWASNGCPLSNSPDLDDLISQVLEEYTAQQKVGTRSASYRNAKKALEMLVAKLRNFN